MARKTWPVLSGEKKQFQIQISCFPQTKLIFTPLKVWTQSILAIRHHHVVLPALRPCKICQAWRYRDVGPNVQLP